MPAIPALADDLLIAIEYDSQGREWCRLWDVRIIGWVVDDTASGGKYDQPIPIISGALPVKPPATAQHNPQWAKFHGPGRPLVTVPNLWRGHLEEFLIWLATNNNGKRGLIGRFGLSGQLINGFDAFRSTFPDLVMPPDFDPPIPSAVPMLKDEEPEAAPKSRGKRSEA